MVHKSNYRFLFNSLISLLIIIGVVLFTQISMSNPDKFCITPEPGDSNFFGSSIAINGQYLAIGDPNANRVSIYTRNYSNRWVRTKYILPPANSLSNKIGRGFGTNIELDNDVLLINDKVVVISPETEQYTKDIVQPKEFQVVDSIPLFIGRYLVKLSSDVEPQSLKYYPDETPGFSEFIILSEGKLKPIALPNKGEEKFGNSIAYYKHLFLVGSPNFDTGGGAWLFELDKPEKKPLRFTLPETYIGTTVAVSEQFAAVGYRADLFGFFDVPDLPTKTLIRTIDSDAISVIDEVGRLSLSKNILAVMRPKLPDSDLPGLLKVFHLDQNAIPNLILQREHLLNGFVENGFLVTVEDDNFSSNRICLESID